MNTLLTEPMSIKEILRLIEEHYFYVPKEVHLERKIISRQGWRYIFKHETFGELGSLILSEKNDMLKLAIKVSGIPNHPLTQQKAVILETITRHIMEALKSVLGFEESKEKDDSRPEIECQDVLCAQCGGIVALVISAPQVESAAELAQCSEILVRRVTELNVPTWVIGDVTEIKMGSYIATKLLALKIWPHRIRAKEMLTMTFKAKLDKLMQEHCGAI